MQNRDAQGFLPLTVKQISSDGVDINNVKLVGMVFNKEDRIREFTFVLDDQTGRIDCHRWVYNHIDLKEMAEIRNGTFAEIQGHLKGFQGKNHLEAYCVRPVTDIGQVAYRFTECMLVHCHNTESQGQSSNSAQPSSNQTSPLNQFYWQPTIAGIRQKVLDLMSISAHM